MITVTFTVSGRREKYLHETLRSWAAVRGVQDVGMLFNVEPPRPSHFPFAEFKNWSSAMFRHARFAVNDRRLGCKDNTREAMERAFAGGSEFAILAEEDVLVSADVLEYMTWAAERFKDRQDVLAVCAHVLESRVAEPESVTLAPWFNPLIWGTWPDRWRGTFMPEVFRQTDSTAWDGQLRTALRREGKLCAYPVLSRSTHIGEASLLTPEPLQSKFFMDAKSRCFAPDYTVSEYREVSFEREDLGLLV